MCYFVFRFVVSFFGMYWYYFYYGVMWRLGLVGVFIVLLKEGDEVI